MKLYLSENSTFEGNISKKDKTQRINYAKIKYTELCGILKDKLPKMSRVRFTDDNTEYQVFDIATVKSEYRNLMQYLKEFISDSSVTESMDRYDAFSVECGNTRDCVKEILYAMYPLKEENEIKECIEKINDFFNIAFKPYYEYLGSIDFYNKYICITFGDIKNNYKRCEYK